MGDFSAYGRGGPVPSELRLQDRQEKERELRREAEHEREEKTIAGAAANPRWWRRLLRSHH